MCSDARRRSVRGCGRGGSRPGDGRRVERRQQSEVRGPRGREGRGAGHPERIRAQCVLGLSARRCWGQGRDPNVKKTSPVFLGFPLVPLPWRRGDSIGPAGSGRAGRPPPPTVSRAACRCHGVGRKGAQSQSPADLDLGCASHLLGVHPVSPRPLGALTCAVGMVTPLLPSLPTFFPERESPCTG